MIQTFSHIRYTIQNRDNVTVASESCISDATLEVVREKLPEGYTITAQAIYDITPN